MTNWSFEHTADTRSALRTIVSDPAYGVAALSNVHVMSELLPHLLRGASLERSVLVTAARESLSAAMLEHVSEGMDPVLAVRLSANLLASTSAIPIAACYWVAAELALALGLISIDQADELGADGGADGAQSGWRSGTPPTVIGSRPHQSDDAPGSGSEPSPTVISQRPPSGEERQVESEEPGEDERPWLPASDEGAAAARPDVADDVPDAGRSTGAGHGSRGAQQTPPGYGQPDGGRAGQQTPGYAQPPAAQPAAQPDAQPAQWSPAGPAGYAAPGAGGRQPVAQADDWISRVVRDTVHPGLLAFNPPSEMQQGRSERIEVGIARSPELRDALTAGLRGRGVTEVLAVDAGPVMGVELRGASFQITPLSPLEQLVVPLARWEFDVTALRSGSQRLTLCVSIRLDAPFPGGGRIAVPVLERDIRIHVDVVYGARRFVASNWQWLVGTAIALGGGIAAWISLVH